MNNIYSIINKHLKSKEFKIKNGKLVDSNNNEVLKTDNSSLSAIYTKKQTTINL